MPRTIALILAICALPALGAENLITNGDFSDGLEGWTPNRAETQPVADTVQFHTPPAALRIPSTAERVGVMTPLIELEEPLPNALTVSGWVRVDAFAADAGIGLDLRILLDDGTKTWFFPDSLQVRAADVGEWVKKAATYIAPTGRTIAATAAYCLNYRSDGATAWFDDITLTAHVTAEPRHDVAVLYAGGPDDPGAAQVGAALTAAGVEHDVLPIASDFSSAKLVIVPEWVEDERLYFRLKVLHYLGGRVILLNLPDEYFATGLSRYFWDRPAEALTEPLIVSDDGRAAHVADVDAVDPGGLINDLLAAEIDLPDEVPALDCGPKPSAALRDGALYIDGEPLLWRAMGTYAVRGDTPMARHAANFAHYARDLNLNGLVVYVNYDVPAEHLRAVLDTAWAEDLRALIWIRGPAVRSYSEKPLKDEWVLELMPLRSHPAWLGWEMADDTWGQHLTFLERTSRVIRRYDQQNLVTTTVMDLRRPERLPEEQWELYREVIDYPLTYLYPLQKGRAFGGTVDIEGGFEDVQRLSQHAREYWGEDVYIQQWCQAHMQGPSYPKVGIPTRSTYVPSAEQQRLLTYMMLTSGTRGIAYFSTYGLADNRLGMGRRAELGLLWGELKPVEDIIAAGEIAPCETSVPSVEARAFTLDGETVVLAVKHGEEYNRYVHNAVVEDLAITLPLDPPEGARCLRLDGPRPMPVMPFGESGTFALEEFDVTTALLITSDDDRLAALEAQRAGWAPLAARLAATAAADTGAKMRVVGRRLGPLADEEFAQLLVEGGEAFEEVATCLEAGTYDEAWRWSRVALRKWRQARAHAIERAEAERARLGLGEEALPLLNIYPALPNFAHEYLGANEPDYAVMHEEIISALAELDFLVREPVL